MEVRLFEILLDDDDFIKVGIIKLFRKKRDDGREMERQMALIILQKCKINKHSEGSPFCTGKLPLSINILRIL